MPLAAPRFQWSRIFIQNRCLLASIAAILVYFVHSFCYDQGLSRLVSNMLGKMKAGNLLGTLCSLVAMMLASVSASASSPLPNARRQDSNATTYPNYRISPLDGSIIALPTQDQLDFQDKEMGMLIHFEVATYISIDGCNGVPGLVPSPELFDPTLLNTDQWMQSITGSGAKYATLVAKHNCGFTTWPSAVTFETRDNTTSPYNYSVAYSPVSGTDVVQKFSDSAVKYGVGHGFYYSTVVNNFLNVQNSLVNSTWSAGEIRISNETYDEIVIAQLTELWTKYGQLTEVGCGSSNVITPLESLHSGV